MRRAIILLAVLGLGLLTSIVVDFQITKVPVQLTASANVGSSLGIDWVCGMNTTTTVGQSVKLNPIISGGAPPYTYQWYYTPYPNGEPMPSSVSSSFTFTPTSSGFYTISVRVKDSLDNEAYFVGLPSGIWVTVFAKSEMSSSVPKAPVISILSPRENSVYNHVIALNFSLQTSGEFENPYEANHKAWWEVTELSYSLDGKANVTLAGNTIAALGSGNITLNGIPAGNHSIVMYAKRAIYYGIYFGGAYDSFSSALVYFTVNSTSQIISELSPENSETPNQEPFPTTWIAAIVTSAIVVSAGVWQYFFRKKKASRQMAIKTLKALVFRVFS